MAVPDGRIRTPRVRRVPARISRIERLSHDTIGLTVTTLAGELALHPRAGQFCTLKVPGIERPRPYSLARAPAVQAPGEHAFVIRLLPDGELSAWFRERDRTGTRVELGGPMGRFRLDPATGPIVCIAGGSGMSVIFALLEDACHAQIPRAVHFYYGARQARDLYWQSDVATIARNWPADQTFTYRVVLSDEPQGSAWRGARGFVSDAALAPGEGIDWAAASVFLCGPPAMIDAAIPGLIAAGVAPARCYHDRFEDIRAPAPTIDNTRCVLCDECLLVKPVDGCIVETASLEFDPAGASTGFRPHVPGHGASLYYNALVVDPAACIRCGACSDACPHGAISRSPGIRATTLRQR